MKNKERPRDKLSQKDIDLENKRLDREVISSFDKNGEVDMIPDGDVSMYSDSFLDWLDDREIANSKNEK